MEMYEAPDEAYFNRLAGYSRDFIKRLAIDAGPQPLDQILGVLKPMLEGRRQDEVRTIEAIPRTTIRRPRDASRAIGLNTVGLLADRLTILVVKEWRLRHDSDARADALAKTEIPMICRALAQAEPDQETFVGKVSSIRAGAEADSWAGAYYGLLSANLLLWQAQEVLYVHDILALPAEEIRAYIRWFSIGNMLRNEYIALCEQLIWRKP